MRKRSHLLFIVLLLAINLTHAQEKLNFGKIPLTKVKKTLQRSTDQSILYSELKPISGTEFRLIKTEIDKSGITHRTYQQYYNGIKVHFGVLKVHDKNGLRQSYNGAYFNSSGVKTRSSISTFQIQSIAKQFMGSNNVFWLGEGELSKDTKPKQELLILPNRRTGELNLVYAIGIGVNGKELRMGTVYIDASNGTVLKYDNQFFSCFGVKGNKLVHNSHTKDKKREALYVSGTAATAYSGSQSFETLLDGNYILNDESRATGSNWNLSTQGLGTKTGIITVDIQTGTDVTGSLFEFTDNNNTWTAAEMSANEDQYALDVHWGSQLVYDYWNNEHSHNSYNGSNGALLSLVHYGTNYTNAGWAGISNTSGYMIYGDGSGSYTPLTTLDVVAHEIAHGINNATSNLDYELESGALNEGLSDIWAMVIENYSNNNYGTSKDFSEINEENGGGAFRSMSNPNNYSQPDTYGGTHWYDVVGCTPDGDTNSGAYNDYCGVHTNSGVLNYWFWLLSQGGSGTNDNGDTFNVGAIGMDDAAAIVWQMQDNYLTSTSDYTDARTHAIQAAIDLFGSCSQQEQSTTNAFYAVGVGAGYVVVNPSVSSEPNDVSTCEGDMTSFSVSGSDYDSLQWQVDDGSGWSNISNDGTYSGATSTTLTITNPLFSMDAYDYRVQLINSCSTTNSNTVVLDVDEYPVSSVVAQNETCIGGDGSLTFTFSDNSSRTNIEFSIDGGTNYDYNYDDATSPQTLSSLSAATYNIWVRWGNDECPLELGDFIISTGTTPTASSTGTTNETCSLNDGSIALSFFDNATETQIDFSIDGGLNYDYSFDDTMGTGSITGLTPGDYDVWASYGGSCAVSIGTFTVDSEAPIATVTPVDSTIGGSDGGFSVTFIDNPSRNVIKFSIDGGVNYPYNFNNSLGTASITGLAATTYNVWVVWGNDECPKELGDYTINESADYVSIPDSNFESALNDLGYDDLLGDNKVPLALINTVQWLNVANEGITDLTGIEYFTALTNFDCSYNSLTSMDMTSNVLLDTFRCDNNSALTSINTSANTALLYYEAFNCALSTIDISNNLNLLNLEIYNNSFTSLDLSNHASLEVLDCSDNNLTYLNIKNGNNTMTANSEFDATGNPSLTCIEVDDVAYSTTTWTNIDGTASFSLYCAYTAIPDANFEAALEALGYDDISADGQVPTSLINTVTSLNVDGASISDLTGIEDFVALETLDADNNSLTSVDVSALSNLITLRLDYNNLTIIDVTANTNLETLSFRNNTVASLDLSNNVLLKTLHFQFNDVATLDLTNNTALTGIICRGNDLTSLDLSQNVLLNNFWAGDNFITSMDLSNNTLLAIVQLYNNELTYLDLRNGNNTIINNFSLTSNSSLSCILVDDAAYSTSNWTNIDSHTNFYETGCAYTTIPDANFESALETLGYDNISGDGQVPTNWIETVNNLDVSNNNIADLTGIEDFIGLENLYVTTNNLTSIDLSNLSNLDRLYAQENFLTTIDLSNNTLLTYFTLRDNEIANLDVSNNTDLTHIYVSNNNITSLDLTNNSNLEVISLSGNQLNSLNTQNGNNTNVTTFNTTGNSNLFCILVDDTAYSTTNWTSIDGTTSFSESDYCRYTAIPDANFEAWLEAQGYDDISSDGQVPTALIEVVTSVSASYQDIADFTGLEDFTALESLTAAYNSFTQLDVSNNVNLTFLHCGYSSLTGLDVSANLLLETLWISSTSVSTLDLSLNTSLTDLVANSNSSLVDLNIQNGNNTNVSQFNTAGCASLSCIIVDDAAYSTTNWTNIDVGHSFSESDYCQYTAIPDTNFEAELEALGYDDISNDGQVPTALIEVVTSLDVSSKNISDLTGIEDFTALISLVCESNSITSLDLSNNVVLETIDADANDLTSLILPTNGSLITFICNNNANLTTVDFSGNINLESIQATNNDLTTVNFSNLPVLTSLFLSSNNLTNVDISTLTSLESFSINSNGLTSIDLSNNSSLTSLDVSQNSLTSLDINNNLALEYLTFTDNTINTIDVQNHTSLIWLYGGQNVLSSIDITNNTALERLWLNDNNLTSIDLSSNILLSDLVVNNNFLDTIDVSANTAASWLFVDGNNLTSLDLSNNIALSNLTVFDNDLEYLNLKNGNNTNISFSIFTGNPNLACILVDDAAYSTTNWTNIDVQTSFSDTYCSYTAIPNANFEAELEALGYDDISADGQVPTALIEVVTSLSIQNKGISDLTGIEDFTALVTLACRQNGLTNLDISQNTLLETLAANNNDILSIDLSNNLALKNINLGANELTEIDVTNHPLLENLQINNNDISSLDISFNTALKELRTYNTDISTIDLSNNPLITLLRAYDSPLSALDLSNNPNIEELRVENTSISILDLSNNPLITTIRVNDTNLSSLDLSTQTDLTFLRCQNTNLSYLNLKNGNNTNVTSFQATGNSNLDCILVDDATYSTTNWTDIDGATSFSDTYCRYTSIPDANFEAALDTLGYDDISSDGQVPTALIEVVTTLHVSDESISNLTGIEDFTALLDLNVQDNNLSNLDLTNNILLEDLNCSSNNFFNLDLSQNVSLNSLYADNGWLIELDVSANTQLQYLYLANNNFLNYLNYQNGNNTNNLFFNATGTPNLTCILVDDEVYSTTNWTSIDVGASFEDTYCRYTAIPDANFEAALEALGYDDISSDGQVPTALIEVVTILDVSNENIADLTGIEDFEALTALDCSSNQIAEVNFGSNVPLSYLDISTNDLTLLEVPTSIENLLANSNHLVYLDLTSYVALQELSLYNNELIYLNIQNGVNTNIYNLITTSNDNLTCIIVDDVAYSDTNWNNIDVTTSFSTTYCRYTQVPDINFETRLENLGHDDISGDGQVPTGLIIDEESLDISYTNSGAIYDTTGIEDFYALNNLILNDNLMASIDLSSNINLRYVTAENTSLTSLDLSANNLLEYVLLDDNSDLISLNLQNGNNTNMDSPSDFQATNTPNLTCVLVDNATYSVTTWVGYIDPQIMFSDTECILDYKLEAKAYLQGAALNPNTGEETLMRDDLRVTGLITTTSPYTDAATCASTVFNTGGTAGTGIIDDDIVDWVWVELRDQTDNTLIVTSQSALLQRDGDIVDVDGISSLTFSLSSGDYYIVIKHRNHLSIMSKNIISLSTTSTIIDFTDANNQITYGTDAQTTYGMLSGIVAMWAGDANGDGQLNYSGALSDVPGIRSQVFNDPNNSVFGGPPVASYQSVGYNTTDIDMDGLTVYSGGTSDVLHIRNNIFNNPSNSVFGGPPTATYLFIQQLPEGGN
ncbi:M4 family metallopeptidase [uncultured Lacinutrix sp.]|uniref:M4 family metallopeptidase n=1 Tax=uncultured Lacinutrix sp. TaxID=574032 RepID=UPI002602F4F8|nr:M4 family metallopeptidase [uncultured Lacinutrix sp.]